MVNDSVTGSELPEDDRVKPIVEIAAGIFLAAIAIFALYWVFPNYIVAVAGANDVGPEFFPKLATWTVLGLSILLIVTRIVQIKSSDGGMRGRSILLEIVIWSVISVLSVLGLLNIGFLIMSPLIILFGAIACGYRNVWAIVFITIAVPLVLDQAAWLIFTVDLP
jgi:hypothetical protein